MLPSPATDRGTTAFQPWRTFHASQGAAPTTSPGSAYGASRYAAGRRHASHPSAGSDEQHRLQRRPDAEPDDEAEQCGVELRVAFAQAKREQQRGQADHEARPVQRRAPSSTTRRGTAARPRTPPRRRARRARRPCGGRRATRARPRARRPRARRASAAACSARRRRTRARSAAPPGSRRRGCPSRRRRSRRRARASPSGRRPPRPTRASRAATRAPRRASRNPRRVPPTASTVHALVALHRRMGGQDSAALFSAAVHQSLPLPTQRAGRGCARDLVRDPVPERGGGDRERRARRARRDRRARGRGRGDRRRQRVRGSLGRARGRGGRDRRARAAARLRERVPRRAARRRAGGSS